MSPPQGWDPRDTPLARQLSDRHARQRAAAERVGQQWGANGEGTALSGLAELHSAAEGFPGLLALRPGTICWSKQQILLLLSLKDGRPAGPAPAGPSAACI